MIDPMLHQPRFLRHSHLALLVLAIELVACGAPVPRCPRRAAGAGRSPLPPVAYLKAIEEAPSSRRVVEAARAIEAGTVLRTSLLQVGRLPPTVRWAGHLRPVDLVHFAGRRLRRSVRRGEAIRRSDLEGMDEGSGPARSVLPRGARAITLAVDWVGGSGYWLRPGDLVDVGLVLPGGQGSSPSLRILMQRARVLAVSAAPVDRREDRAKGMEPAAKTPGSPWVMVLCLPREAHALALAVRLGRIVIFPRGEGEGRTTAYPPVTRQDLENPAFWRKQERERVRTIGRPGAPDEPGIQIK